MHFCHEELLAILASFAGLRVAAVWIQAWWHRFRGGCKHDEAKHE